MNKKNKMDNKIIILTQTFPFGDEEQFLETEIVYINKYFSDIMIIPMRHYGGKRPIPKSAKIDLTLSNTFNKFRSHILAIRIIIIIFAIIKSHILFKEILLKLPFLLNYHSFGEMISVLHYALVIKDWLTKNIKARNINLRDTLFYTYWLDLACLGICLNKNDCPQIKIVSRAHSMDLYEERHFLNYIPFQSFKLKYIDKIFAISEHGKNYIINHYNIDHSKVILSRLGVDDSGSVTASSSDGIFRIVSCSFLVPVKRLSLLIEALCKFAQCEPNLQIVWTHIGGGPLRDHLEEQAKKLLPSTISYRFLGMLANAEVKNFYRYHPVDVFINVSESEGIPVSIMEAQSYGIPVIATAVGGTPEIVNNDNGFLLSNNPNAIDIANALKLFINVDQDVIRKRIESKKNWQQKYNAAENYKKFCSMMQQIVNE